MGAKAQGKDHPFKQVVLDNYPEINKEKNILICYSSPLFKTFIYIKYMTYTSIENMNKNKCINLRWD